MNEQNIKKYTHRLVARTVIEAKSPIAVGSGRKDMLTDSLVATDASGLPYIPATTVAGVLRHLIGEEKAKITFGKSSQNKNEVTGSQIIFTDAMLVGEDGKAVDGLQNIDRNAPFLSHYFTLPIRQHVRMSDKGTAETKNAGKFDEQVVYKGSRFCFEVELVSTEGGTETFKSILQQLAKPTFRLGGGTHCGLGEVEVVSCKGKVLDLKNDDDRNWYASKSSDLAKDWEGEEWLLEDNSQVDADTYLLTLKPDDFFLFGSGFGDDEADMTPVKELVVTWNEGLPSFSKQQTLIPATSVKGAVAHRVAYHYNKLKEYYVGNDKAKAGSENDAVKALFGYTEGKESQKGNVFFTDVFVTDAQEKVIPHVAIDRFTGGTIDGALFAEKTSYGNHKEIKLEVVCKHGEYGEQVILAALEEALKDICKGLLPLGGGVNRGNGTFKGTLTRNGETIYENK